MRITGPVIGMALAVTSLAACSGNHDAASSNASVAGTTASAPVVAMPRPGLWQMTVAADGMPKPMKIQTCIGTPARGANPFTPPTQPGVACTKNALVKTANGYSIDSECKMDGMTMSTRGDVSGDFSSAYSIAMKTRMSGPNIPAAMQNERVSTVEAKYGGACPAGMPTGTAKQAG